MRRRTPTPAEVVPGQIPPRLRRFVVDDWADPDDEDRGEWPTERHVRAWRRFLAARRAWEAETGTTIRQIREEHLAVARAGAHTVEDLNGAAYAPESFVDTDDPDPRLGPYEIHGEGNPAHSERGGPALTPCRAPARPMP